MKTLVSLESYNGYTIPGRSVCVDLNINEVKKIINCGKEYELIAHKILREPTKEKRGTCFVKVIHEGRLLSDEICVIGRIHNNGNA